MKFLETPPRPAPSLSLPAAALLIGTVLAAASPAVAIDIRHDRDDSAYRARADRYPMVCDVGGGMGTL